MTLTELLVELRIEIQDAGSVIWTTAELTRAVQKTVSLMSRFIPKRVVVETTLTREITSEALTIASSTGTLAYKPVKVGSPVITGEVLDTDYSINYLTGVVTEIGALLADGAYIAKYDLDPLMLDISTLLPEENFIRIERVEYPAGDDPPTYITFEVFGELLLIKGKDIGLTTNKHLRIIYLKPWTAPATNADGDYPEHLDNPILIGSAGQALIMKAELYVQNARTQFTNADTTLDSMDTPLADVNVALDKVFTPLAQAVTYLTSGAALINTVNVGANAAGNYAAYANAEIAIAQGWIAEAVQRVTLSNGFQNKANSEVQVGLQLLSIAGRYLASGQAKINEFLISLGIKPELSAYKGSSEQFS